MSTVNTIIAHPVNDDKLESLKAFLTALKIKFEVANEEPYDEKFVKMIKKGEEDEKNENFTRINKEDLQSLLGLE